MILSGINFSLYFMCLKGKGKRLFQDDEFRWFMKSVSILTLVITFALVFQNHYDWEEAFRRALFQVATAHTSCGFATDDYNLWPSFYMDASYFLLCCQVDVRGLLVGESKICAL